MISANEVLQEAYAGAQDVGFRIVGISDVDTESVLSGPRDAPIDIGHRVTLTVREAADGRLLPRREDAAPGDPPARWLLKIDVAPRVELDVDLQPRVTWVAFVRRIDVATSRIVSVGKPGVPNADEAIVRDSRPVHEYLNDPAYHDAMRDAEAAGRIERRRSVLRAQRGQQRSHRHDLHRTWPADGGLGCVRRQRHLGLDRARDDQHNGLGLFLLDGDRGR